jgi:hypothetical protein
MTCQTCKYQDLGISDIPCLVCPDNPKTDGERRSGPVRQADVLREPCQLTGRSCRTCVHSMIPQKDTDKERCRTCSAYFAHWRPVDDNYSEGGV